MSTSNQATKVCVECNKPLPDKYATFPWVDETCPTCKGYHGPFGDYYVHPDKQ